MPEKKPFEKLDIGWMSPNGDFYPVDYYEHISIGEIIFRNFYNDDCGNTEEGLKDRGWIEIHKLTFMDHRWVIAHNCHLSIEQIRLLKPVVEKEKDMIFDYDDLLFEFER